MLQRPGWFGFARFLPSKASRRFAPGSSQVSAKPGSLERKTRHNSSKFQRFFNTVSPELLTQHCLPEGRQLLEQLCREIKVHATNFLSISMCNAGRRKPLSLQLDTFKKVTMKTRYTPGIQQSTIKVMSGTSPPGKK